MFPSSADWHIRRMRSSLPQRNVGAFGPSPQSASAGSRRSAEAIFLFAVRILELSLVSAWPVAPQWLGRAGNGSAQVGV
jgi:hypothetical protein